MEFDIRTCDSAYRFVLNFMDMTPDEFITELIIESDNDFETFWSRNLRKIEAVDTGDLRIIAFHVLGSLDKCKEIMDNGLMNLQEVLCRNTILSKLLKKSGIFFDISNKVMYRGNHAYDIDYNHYKSKHCLCEIEENLQSIAHRVYYDFCVNGFMLNDNVFEYGTRLHERPEFLMTLSKLFSEANQIEQYWERNAKSYRIDFYATIDQIHRFNFELDEERDPPYDGWLNLDDKAKLKKWMLSHAIDRANNKLSEEYLYIRDDVIIPPEQIISYNEM